MDMRVTEKSTLWAKISPWIVKKGAYWVTPVLKQDAPEEIVILFEKWKKSPLDENSEPIDW